MSYNNYGLVVFWTKHKVNCIFFVKDAVFFSELLSINKRHRTLCLVLHDLSRKFNTYNVWFLFVLQNHSFCRLFKKKIIVWIRKTNLNTTIATNKIIEKEYLKLQIQDNFYYIVLLSIIKIFFYLRNFVYLIA